MIAPLLKLLPWNHPPTQAEIETIVELIHDLDQAQEDLDLADQQAKKARLHYLETLHTLESAATRRAEVGAQLRRTPTGQRVWRQWTKVHLWGRHHDDNVFAITR